MHRQLRTVDWLVRGELALLRALGHDRRTASARLPTMIRSGPAVAGGPADMTFTVPHPIGPSDSPTRRLPPGCSIRRTSAGDVERVAGLLSAEDRLEMETLEGRPALDVLQGWVAGGSHVLRIRDDAAAIFGIVPCSGSPTTSRAATPWVAMVSTLERDDLINVVWLSRLQVDVWQRRWPVLQTVCDTRNRFHSQWLNWLGFECRGRVERFGAAGQPFDLHVRRGDMGQQPAAGRIQ